MRPPSPTGLVIGGDEELSRVTVEADPGRIDSLLGSIDFTALAATLVR